MASSTKIAGLIACVALGVILAGCDALSPGAKRAHRPVCAGPATPLRVNFHAVVDRDGDTAFPNADVFHDHLGPVTVKRQVAISGERILRVVGSFDGEQPAIAVALDDEGAAQLAKATDIPGGGRIALVFDDKLVAAPRFSSAIRSKLILLTTGETANGTNAVAELIDAALPGCLTSASSPP